MQPLRRTEAQFGAFKADIARLARAIPVAEATRSGVDPQALVRARTILAAGRRLEGGIEASGELLSIRVHDINDAVSEQIVATEPDLAAVLAATGRLGVVGATIAPGGLPTTSGTAPNTGLQGLYDRLDPAQALADAASQVASALDEANALDRATAASAACVPAGTARPHLATAVTVIDLRPGASTDLAVAGQGLPRVAVDGPDAASIRAEILVPNGALILHLTAATNAAPGDRTVILSDRDGAETERFVVRVASGAGQPGMPAQGRVGSVVVSNLVPLPKGCPAFPAFAAGLGVPSATNLQDAALRAAIGKRKVALDMAGRTAVLTIPDQTPDEAFCAAVFGPAPGAPPPPKPAAPKVLPAPGEVPLDTGGPGHSPDGPNAGRVQ